jgi:hypothetical protein
MRERCELCCASALRVVAAAFTGAERESRKNAGKENSRKVTVETSGVPHPRVSRIPDSPTDSDRAGEQPTREKEQHKRKGGSALIHIVVVNQ